MLKKVKRKNQEYDEHKIETKKEGKGQWIR